VSASPASEPDRARLNAEFDVLDDIDAGLAEFTRLRDAGTSANLAPSGEANGDGQVSSNAAGHVDRGRGARLDQRRNRTVVAQECTLDPEPGEMAPDRSDSTSGDRPALVSARSVT
jgi:hypothetical protein